MRIVLSALLALAVIGATATGSYAFDAKTFWRVHQSENG